MTFPLTKVSQKTLAEPTLYRLWPALTNYKNRVIYVTGKGQYETTRPSKVCSRYHLNTGTWDLGSQMDEMRYGHSTCVLGDFIYAFGGRQSECGGAQTISSIEFLNCEDDLNGTGTG